MSKYQSRADLLIAAGESIKMQTKAGIEPCLKYQRQIAASLASSGLFGSYDEYEFPIAVVEGKPVFVGDELYSPLGMRFIVDENGIPCCPNTCSWNPPNPKTVNVKLIVEDAATVLGILDIYKEYCQSKESAKRVHDALNKALKELGKA